MIVIRGRLTDARDRMRAGAVLAVLIDPGTGGDPRLGEDIAIAGVGHHQGRIGLGAQIHLGQAIQIVITERLG